MSAKSLEDILFFKSFSLSFFVHSAATPNVWARPPSTDWCSLLQSCSLSESICSPMKRQESLFFLWAWDWLLLSMLYMVCGFIVHCGASLIRLGPVKATFLTVLKNNKQHLVMLLSLKKWCVFSGVTRWMTTAQPKTSWLCASLTTTMVQSFVRTLHVSWVSLIDRS